MKRSPRLVPDPHLSPEDFFVLVMPPLGLPEALPEHLSRCSACSRQLQEWKRAAAELSDAGEGPADGFEAAVMSRVRRLPVPRSHRSQRRALAGLAAAAALVGAFFLGGRVLNAPLPQGAPDAVARMSASDRADDELLRDVSRLVEGEDSSIWKTLAPVPEPGDGNS